MINEEYKEDVLLAKELISSGGGFFAESMLPCIGGPAHGRLLEYRHLQHVYKIEWDEPASISGTVENVYKMYPIVIDNDDETGEYNCMYIYRHVSPYPPYGFSMGHNSTYRLVEVWAKELYEELYGSL